MDKAFGFPNDLGQEGIERGVALLAGDLQASAARVAERRVERSGDPCVSEE